MPKYYKLCFRNTHVINDAQGWLKSLRLTHFKSVYGGRACAAIMFNKMIVDGKLKEVVLVDDGMWEFKERQCSPKNT